MNMLPSWMRPECRRVRKVLQSYLDGELGPEDADMVAEHLDLCDDCGIEADLYQQVIDSLVGLRVRPDPEAMVRLERFADSVPTADVPPQLDERET